MRRKRTETVSFRADEDLLQLLDDARRRFGISRGEWARGIIQAALYRTERELLDQQLADIQKVLDELARSQLRLLANHSRGVFAVLTLVGKIPADDAKELIRVNLKH